MDLALISTMAEAAAAFGVVGSLIFVGLQVRQNSAGVRHAAVQAHMTAYQELYSNIIDSEETAKIVRLGLQNAEQLDDTESMRFYVFTSKVMRIYQGLHWQWRRGGFDDALFHSMVAMLKDFSTLKGWQSAWKTRRHHYDPDFQVFMDDIFASDGGKTLWPETTTEEAG
jgi:hypothetical protein